MRHFEAVEQSFKAAPNAATLPNPKLCLQGHERFIQHLESLGQGIHFDQTNEIDSS